MVPFVPGCTIDAAVTVLFFLAIDDHPVVSQQPQDMQIDLLLTEAISGPIKIGLLKQTNCPLPSHSFVYGKKDFVIHKFLCSPVPVIDQKGCELWLYRTAEANRFLVGRLNFENREAKQ